MKKIVYRIAAIFLAAMLLAASHTYYLYTHRMFGVADFFHPFILHEEPVVRPDENLKERVRQQLNQPFSYLGYGGQMTVYVSADDRFVIKFFNPRSVIKKSWFEQWRKLRYINSPQWVFRTHFKKKEKLRKQFSRYAMAFRDLRNETGLVYVHLDPSTCLSHSMTIVDKEGISQEINLDAYPFVLQKKAELTMDYLGKLVDAGDLQGAREGVRQIYTTFFSRSCKGYTDKAQSLEKNYGFVEGRAVQFDVGRIQHIKRVQQEPIQEMRRIVSHIYPTLEESFPQLAPVLIECLEADYLTRLSDSKIVFGRVESSEVCQLKRDTPSDMLR